MTAMPPSHEACRPAIEQALQAFLPAPQDAPQALAALVATLRPAWYTQRKEAAQRLELVRRQGPTPEAFNFGEAFPPPDAVAGAAKLSFNDTCPA